MEQVGLGGIHTFGLARCTFYPTPSLLGEKQAQERKWPVSCFSPLAHLPHGSRCWCFYLSILTPARLGTATTWFYQVHYIGPGVEEVEDREGPPDTGRRKLKKEVVRHENFKCSWALCSSRKHLESGNLDSSPSNSIDKLLALGKLLHLSDH